MYVLGEKWAIYCRVVGGGLKANKKIRLESAIILPLSVVQNENHQLREEVNHIKKTLSTFTLSHKVMFDIICKGLKGQLL